MADIRLSTPADLDRMASLAADLVRLHHSIDPARFFLAQGIEKGYRGWFSQELQNGDAIMMVALEAERVIGYAYGRIERRDWNMLLDKHAALHDLMVDPDARSQGLGAALLQAFIEESKRRGVPRIVLHTATSNAAAQKLFAKMGFRSTMIEMTLELGA